MKNKEPVKLAEVHLVNNIQLTHLSGSAVSILLHDKHKTLELLNNSFVRVVHEAGRKNHEHLIPMTNVRSIKILYT